MSETELRWVPLLTFNSRAESEIFQEALEAQGISAVIFQNGTASYLSPGLAESDVCVRSDQLEEAQAWLARYEADTLEKLEISQPEAWSDIESADADTPADSPDSENNA